LRDHPALNHDQFSCRRSDCPRLLIQPGFRTRFFPSPDPGVIPGRPCKDSGDWPLSARCVTNTLPHRSAVIQGAPWRGKKRPRGSPVGAGATHTAHGVPRAPPPLITATQDALSDPPRPAASPTAARVAGERHTVSLQTPTQTSGIGGGRQIPRQYPLTLPGGEAPAGSLQQLRPANVRRAAPGRRALRGRAYGTGAPPPVCRAL